MKLSKSQLKRIIKEEKSKLLTEQRDIGSGIFNEDYIFDLFDAEFNDLLQGGQQKVSNEELEMFRQAVNGAVRAIIRYYRE